MLFERFVKFGFVGILTTIFGIVCYFIAFTIYDFPLYPTYFVVYNMGILISYFLNTKYTFNAKYNKKDYLKYFFSYIVGFLVGYLILYIVNLYFPQFSKMTKIVIMIPPRIVLTFILLNSIVYKVAKK